MVSTFAFGQPARIPQPTFPYPDALLSNRFLLGHLAEDHLRQDQV